MVIIVRIENVVESNYYRRDFLQHLVMDMVQLRLTRRRMVIAQQVFISSFLWLKIFKTFEDI